MDMRAMSDLVTMVMVIGERREERAERGVFLLASRRE
jgi:hypothetical protein